MTNQFIHDFVIPGSLSIVMIGIALWVIYRDKQADNIPVVVKKHKAIKRPAVNFEFNNSRIVIISGDNNTVMLPEIEAEQYTGFPIESLTGKEKVINA